MITSLSWLKNHLATKANLNQLVERLTEIGMEVENIRSSNGNLDNFIVCKIIKSQKHPNACLLYTSPSPRDGLLSRMPSSA